MNKSKFTSRQPVKAPANVVGAPQPKVEPMPEPKTRKGRVHRVFNYRGITFFLVTKNETSVVYILDKATGNAKPCIQVSRRDALKAAQALAKIAITEAELESLEHKAPSAFSQRELTESLTEGNA